MSLLSKKDNEIERPAGQPRLDIRKVTEQLILESISRHITGGFLARLFPAWPPVPVIAGYRITLFPAYD